MLLNLNQDQPSKKKKLFGQIIIITCHAVIKSSKEMLFK